MTMTKIIKMTLKKKDLQMLELKRPDIFDTLIDKIKNRRTNI